MSARGGKSRRDIARSAGSASRLGDDEAQFVGVPGLVGHHVNAVGAGAPFAFGGVGEGYHAAFTRRVFAFLRLGHDASAGSRNRADADGLVGLVGEAEFTGHFAAAFDRLDGHFRLIPHKPTGQSGGREEEGQAEEQFHGILFTPLRGGVDLGLAFRGPGNLNGAVSYPAKLQKIIDLFEVLPEEEKRETLIAYADQAAAQSPREGESFDLEDVRKDEECTDTVGVFLGVDGDRKVRFRINLGPQVQTLTRAMTAILCKGFEGATVEEVMGVPADFVPKIVGAQLVRQRSQTVYYILTRMKSACKVWLNRERAAGVA